jgi:hypothetical protein
MKVALLREFCQEESLLREAIDWGHPAFVDGGKYFPNQPRSDRWIMPPAFSLNFICCAAWKMGIERRNWQNALAEHFKWLISRYDRCTGGVRDSLYL